MREQAEEWLAVLLWGAGKLMVPTWQNVFEPYEGWEYRTRFRHQLRSLERRQLLQREKRAGKLVYRLTQKGRLAALGGRDPMERWRRGWDGRWRMIMFDLPVGAKAVRLRLLRWFRQNGFGYLQDSVWITPDPVHDLTDSLSGFHGDVEALTVMEARCISGSAPDAFVNGAWQFPEINGRYQRYIEFITARNAEGKKNASWLGRERWLWKDAVTMDPLLPRELWPRNYLGEDALRKRKTILQEVVCKEQAGVK
jgi:phenylacetic acid degradation operon negative regulatory protein